MKLMIAACIFLISFWYTNMIIKLIWCFNIFSYVVMDGIEQVSWFLLLICYLIHIIAHLKGFR